jgi:hypothetical protein
MHDAAGMRVEVQAGDIDAELARLACLGVEVANCPISRKLDSGRLDAMISARAGRRLST